MFYNLGYKRVTFHNYEKKCFLKYVEIFKMHKYKLPTKQKKQREMLIEAKHNHMLRTLIEKSYIAIKHFYDLYSYSRFKTKLYVFIQYNYNIMQHVEILRRLFRKRNQSKRLGETNNSFGAL